MKIATATPSLRRRRLLTLPLLACGGAAAAAAGNAAAVEAAQNARLQPATQPRIATIPIPGDPRFAAIAREVMRVQTAYVPDFAAQSGLIDDALQMPSFAPARVAALTRRIRASLAGLRALPWRRWSVDAQIDVRWVHANAERIERELAVERLYRQRPGAWLEPVANTAIAVLTWAPARTDALAAISAQLPALVAEMRTLCRPTQVDVDVAIGLIDGITAMLQASAPAGGDAAIAALAGYKAELTAQPAARPFAVIGAANYAWRLRHAALLPWDPAALLALAERRLAEVDAEIAALAPALPPSSPAPPLTPELQATAAALDQASLLALYDRIQTENRAAIEAAGFITIPPGVGPVRARVTPDAMVPLTGDGGSMNPPPPFIDSDTGWWNVEHFNPAMPLAQREQLVRRAALFRDSSMGPYAVHEGFPGHHLQLAIARLNPNPLRSVFADPVQNEGWALYAEEAMWEHGGLGSSPTARSNVLKSWRFRIRRVVYDVHIETGRWTLQQGADWKDQASPGTAAVGPEIRRAVNWPAQLVCYFAGKEQIVALKADAKRAWGTAYSERRFHDELLALGSVPVVFARAKLLGERVPGFAST